MLAFFFSVNIDFCSHLVTNRAKPTQHQQSKTSKIPISKAANEDLKKLIQERRKAAANGTNQNQDIEIFAPPK